MIDTTNLGTWVVFALDREAKYLPPSRHFEQPDRPTRFPHWVAGIPGKGFQVLISGPGSRAAESAMDWLLAGADFPMPSLVIAAGFCGGLNQSQKVGDLVLASAIRDVDGNRWPTTWPGPIAWPDFERGLIVTAPNLIAEPQEKRKLLLQTTATAVDMESAIVAQRCHAKNLPFGCLRAVSDDASMALSAELLGLLQEGRPSTINLVKSLLRRPGLTWELCRLARDTRVAALRLKDGLLKLLG